jgi:hypothetical protein
MAGTPYTTNLFLQNLPKQRLPAGITCVARSEFGLSLAASPRKNSYQLGERRFVVGLQSKQFKGDPALEACLIHDSAHVLQGAVGNHVQKIQTALMELDRLSIDAGELAGKRYGPSTAAAVLAFKKQRRIINFGYQTQEDNIVGKMTMAALDKEMLAKESRGSIRLCGRKEIPNINPFRLPRL